MALITVTPRHVSPLVGSNLTRYRAGGSGSIGDFVYQAADFDVEATLADAAGTTNNCVGMVVSVGIDGATDFSDGDYVDVCDYGPVDLGNDAGMSVGKVYLHDGTEGGIDQTAPSDTGDQVFSVGRAKNARTLWIDLQKTDAATV